uniref:Putative inositol/phosphatidylinositol phosphatase n=1 Tax=Trypanosoma congolense (strain IL3000) TaxID=1068625 RepID=G0UTS9_TRYCI|nr:putative inositol/phosphatidylinositol phosphatase [Trypanosoma congolense IL3000]
MGIATVATGALGSVGNKGAIGLHLKLYRTSLCLINMHLAAGQKNIAKRNSDVSKIFMGMDFNSCRRGPVMETLHGSGGQSEAQVQYPELLPHNHDIIVVAGDLNYRVNLSYQASLQLAMRNDYATLLKHDEFTEELTNPLSPWTGFVEFSPTFQPTYRYNIGTGNYDTSEKQRVPSYTDRIATWTRCKDHQNSIKLESHRALTDIMCSDHKPVQALFRLPVRREVPEKKNEVMQSLKRRVRAVGLSNIQVAKTNVDVCKFDFGIQSCYECGARRVLTIANVGECVAVAKVFRQSDDDPSGGAWLRVFPTTIFILPGEKKVMMVECRLDSASTQWMKNWKPFEGCGETILSSMLVLCVYCGPVHLVECCCVAKPSVFGNSLDNIALLGNFPCHIGYGRSGPLELKIGGYLPQIPKELWFLCQAIYERGALQPNLFSDSCSSETCVAIMRHLDTQCQPIPIEYDVQCISTCLLNFLQTLLEPVIPYNLYGKALATVKSRSGDPSLFIIQTLPPLHANVWIYVCSLMNFLLRPANARYNGLTAPFVAKALSDVMLVCPTGPSSQYSNKGTNEHEEKPSNVTPRAGSAQQQLRLQLCQEKEDAIRFVQCFLVQPPDIML